MFQKIIRQIISAYAAKRVKRIMHATTNPITTQEGVFKMLIRKGAPTVWGEVYDYKSIDSIKTFQSRIPLSTYEDLYPWIERMLSGEKNILWPGYVKWFAKSSGTTNARSKYLPVTKTLLKNSHYQGGKDMISLYLSRHPESDFYLRNTLAIIGSLSKSPLNDSIICGDVSAVMTSNLPKYAQSRRIPHVSIALLPSWEEKARHIVETATTFDVSGLIGTPTWIALLLEDIRTHYNYDDIYQCWPNLEVFFHGAVSFAPYRPLFQKLLPDNRVKFVEIYNASEGFFAIADKEDSKELLLMVDYGIFYEFIPLSEYGKEDAKAVTLRDVKLDTNYVMIISTTGGLWRYVIGDTVRFTTLAPFHIVITGRTKYFINAFGEEIVAENAESAIHFACEETGAIVSNFTAGPVFMTESENGAHEWIVEFSKVPNSAERFEKALDEKLRELNSDYDAKRTGDAVLRKPIVHYAPLGTFYEWMKSNDKLGGQNKVPILCNSRQYVDAILEIINTRHE